MKISYKHIDTVLNPINLMEHTSRSIFESILNKCARFSQATFGLVCVFIRLWSLLVFVIVVLKGILCDRLGKSTIYQDFVSKKPIFKKLFYRNPAGQINKNNIPTDRPYLSILNPIGQHNNDFFWSYLCYICHVSSFYSLGKYK